MSYPFPDLVPVWRRGAASSIAGLALLLLSSAALAQEELGSEAIGAWHGTYQLDRVDPRIRTRGGSDLLRIQVIHSKDRPTATISWVAGRAICEDPLAEPCDWVGAGGTVEARVVDNALMFALPLSPDESDPMMVSMQPIGGASNSTRISGHAANAKADFGYSFDVTIMH